MAFIVMETLRVERQRSKSDFLSVELGVGVGNLVEGAAWAGLGL